MNKNNLPEATSQDISNLIGQMCNDGLLFTKFDVTKKLRHMGFHVLHKEVKRVMERHIVFPSHYETGITTVVGNQGILFYPDGADTNDYDPNAIAQFKVDFTVDVVDKSSSSVHNYSFDRCGRRYTIKAKFARSAGFPAGASVCVKVEDGKITLNKNDGRTIKVDRYANIRIPKSDFEKAFATMPTEIKVTVKTDAIEILED